ncbi:putative baseplate assembly protein [Natronorarus salvus]|uniref:putative baseplate assembly protein n=1 Tax=Natronorarus salvus TaxID=3117733 RepID=UPI002F260A5A
MSLDVPDLDDRTYEELRADAVKRLPVHAPEWTDHNVHDPGITILELLAWLVETYGYQLDRVTDDHRRKYLELVGVTPHPPRSASVDLSVATGDEAVAGELPARTPIVVETPDREVIRFETETDIVLTPATIDAVVSEHARGRTDHTVANESEGRSFLAFGTEASVGNALYLGFDGDPFAEGNRLDLVVDFHDDDLPDPAGDPHDPIRFVPSIAVVWERLTDPERWYRDDAWEELDLVHDGTDAFYTGGRVGLAEPSDRQGEAEAAAILARDTPLIWVRAVARAREDDEDTERRIPTCAERSGVVGSGSQTGVRDRTPTQTERYELPPTFDAIRTNVVAARQRERVPSVGLERIDRPGDERPAYPPSETAATRSQRFAFPTAPVVDAEVVVGDTRWTAVDDFGAAGPDDRCYVLDRERGVVTFGDGRRGAIPLPGQTVSAGDVVYGGGPQGNVPRGSTWMIEGPKDTLEADPLARPAGGRGAESIAAAFDRARDQQRIPYRAVTASDHRAIAMRTPGVRVGRAAAVVDCADDASGSPNEVTVVVIPFGPPGRRPIPTRGFLEAVEYQLCAHSLLTDRISVSAPTYVSIRVTAEVVAVEGIPHDDVRDVAAERLETFIDPLVGYDGDGWPFDRPVHRSDVFEVLANLPTVADVIDVSIGVGDEADLEADHTSVPYLAAVSIDVREERETCGRGL